MTRSPDRREIGAYLAGVVGLAVACIGLLYALFRADIFAFYQAVLENPASAVRNDPGTLVVIIATLVLFGLLVSLVVVFGAKHGPEPEGRRR